VPLSLEDQDKERKLADLRRMADNELRDRLPVTMKDPPFRLVGKFTCFAGVLLFVVAE